jgi:hypothetical protein
LATSMRPILPIRLAELDRLGMSQDADRLRMSERSSNNSMLGGSMQRSILLPANPYKMRVHMSANQSVPNNTSPTVQFNTPDFDTANAFDTTAFAYTIPIDGYWAIYVKIPWAPAGNLTNFTGSLSALLGGTGWQGSTAYVESGTFSGTGGNVLINPYESILSDLKYFDKGNVISVQGFQVCAPAAAQNIQGGVAVDSAYFTMHLIST